MREVKCVAESLYHEARGESVSGIVAVGEVVLHRSKPGFSLCDVVYEHVGEGCTFTWACHRASHIAEPEAWKRSMAIADVLVKQPLPDVTGGATHFQVCGDGLSRQLPLTARFGAHCFYADHRVSQPKRQAVAFSVVGDETADYGYRLVVSHGAVPVKGYRVQVPVEVAEAPQDQ